MSFPEELWTHLLRYVPLKQRLESCSLVSKRLYAAAAAATASVIVEVNFKPRCSQALQQWLQQHGRHVTTLRVNSTLSGFTTLPCQNLRQLDLIASSVQLGPTSSHPGIIQGCPVLTSLRINSSDILDGQEGLSGLSAATGLQSLVLEHIELLSNGKLEVRGFLPSTVMKQLPSLTHLTLGSSAAITTASLQHLSCLVSLQELSITCEEVSLLPSTTKLPTGLTRLHTMQCSLDPTVLQGCTSLRSLCMSCTTILGPPGSLLAVLGRLTQLQHLQFGHMSSHWPQSPSAYTALTASSQLQQLYLYNCALCADIWRYVFRYDQKLPQLHTFGVSQPANRGLPSASGLTAADLRALVWCCPALRDLELDLQLDIPLEELTLLTGLTRLQVEPVTEQSFGSLAALTSLRELRLSSYVKISGGTWLMLTCLQQLTRLVSNEGSWPFSEGPQGQAVQPRMCFIQEVSRPSGPRDYVSA